MIQNQSLLRGVSLAIHQAIARFEFNIGSRLNVQVLVSATQRPEIVEAFIAQGDNIDKVNKVREAADMHKITSSKNEKIVLDEWVPLLKDSKGVVLVVLNGQNRIKINETIESAIDEASSQYENIHFDKIEGTNADFIFVYDQDKKINSSGPKKAADVIKEIKAATNADEVDSIVGDDERSTVLKAAEEKKAEFES